MVFKSETRAFEINEGVYGGDGEMIKRCLTDINPVNVRTCNEIILQPGSSIGFHLHYNETEIYYILQGSGEYYDNDQTLTVKVGDTAVCRGGDGHGIKNSGNAVLRFFAIIILE